MTIQRVVDGRPQVFELTGRELCDAYLEAQRGYDEEDVRTYIEEYGDDSLDLPTDWNDDMVAEAASLSRQCQDNDDYLADQLWENVRYAIEQTCRAHSEVTA